MEGLQRFLKVLLFTGLLMPEAAMPAAADTIRIGGTGAALGTMKRVAEDFKKKHSGAEVLIVPGLGSEGGRNALVGGAIDIAVTSKAGKKVEKVGGALALLFGRTPFVFVTSRKNPVSHLTIEEIVDIWSGKTTTWLDGTRLRLILRPAADSDTDVLKSISPAVEEAVKAALSRPGMIMAVTDDDSANAIESVPGALGTTTLALMLSDHRPLKALSLDGMMPSPEAIARGSYPYFKSMYLVTRTQPSSLARQFVSFVLSPRGGQLLAHLGYWVVQGKEGP